MQSFIRKRVVTILSFLSRRVLSIHDPIIIAITGNIGKTTTKDYIFSLLKYKFVKNNQLTVRASQKSENSEFGVNLTILGEKNAWNNGLKWAKIILKHLLTFTYRNFPEVLVLEVGADKPGDIKYITSIIKPDLVVLTAFQKTPTHGEFFTSIEQHINEKKFLVEKMKKDGVIVYNADDEVMSKMAHEKAIRNPRIKTFTFGYSEKSNVQILENTNLYNDDAEVIGVKMKFGIRFENFSDEVDLRLLGIVGDAHAYSLAAAVCVAILNGYEKQDLQNAMKNLESGDLLSKSRMRILGGINNSILVDDSYNSSPKACENAIDTVSKILNKGKKIAILGHMAELGERTKIEHFKIGVSAAKYFDTIIFSGRCNDYFLEGVRETKTDLSKIFLAKNSTEVIQILNENNLVKENDLILIKGSQSARLERVVVELLMNPRDQDLVCRQDKEWQNR